LGGFLYGTLPEKNAAGNPENLSCAAYNAGFYPVIDLDSH
jgi:hypothetical protein